MAYWQLGSVRQFGLHPLGSYLLLHGGARLNDADVSLLQSYLLSICPRKPSDTEAVRKNIDNGVVAPEWNGIAYVKGFENWKAISTTDRFDNGTMRVVFGNELAVKAMEEHNINPWPDGAVLAKVAWADQTDGAGIISAGQFWQVEFMIKDNKKYAATKGWGWGRWRGANLKPYGLDASFTQECLNCHRPMDKNDLVFTYPLRLNGVTTAPGKQKQPLQTAFNEEASFTAPGGLAPLKNVVLNTFVDTAAQTMSTLYGNNNAASYLRTHSDGNYPDGCELTLVTWQQQPDPRWFGGNIPGAVRCVQVVRFNKGPHYAFYTGNPLHEAVSPNASAAIKWIANQKILILP